MNWFEAHVKSLGNRGAKCEVGPDGAETRMAPLAGVRVRALATT
jgi:hypothetical protein